MQCFGWFENINVVLESDVKVPVPIQHVTCGVVSPPVYLQFSNEPEILKRFS